MDSVICHFGVIYIDGFQSVRWLFAVGLVPTDFFDFSKLFSKPPSVSISLPLRIGRGL